MAGGCQPLGAHPLQRSCYESILTFSDGRCACRMRPESHRPSGAVQRAGESPRGSFVDDKRSTKSVGNRSAEPELRVRDCTKDRKSTRLNSSHVEISYAV